MDDLEAKLDTLLERIRCLSQLEQTKEVEVSLVQLCGEYGGLQREMQEAGQ
jgi:hypothetical protein